jgi:hypothetical protein
MGMEKELNEAPTLRVRKYGGNRSLGNVISIGFDWRNMDSVVLLELNKRLCVFCIDAK